VFDPWRTVRSQAAFPVFASWAGDDDDARDEWPSLIGGACRSILRLDDSDPLHLPAPSLSWWRSHHDLLLAKRTTGLRTGRVVVASDCRTDSSWSLRCTARLDNSSICTRFLKQEDRCFSTPQPGSFDESFESPWKDRGRGGHDKPLFVSSAGCWEVLAVRRGQDRSGPLGLVVQFASCRGLCRVCTIISRC
jgi:hypothetical protein